MATTMTTEADALYRLMSWLSPSFPVGAFSYSHGIEYAVEAGLVRDEESLRDWIDAGLAHEFGPVNGAMLRAAYEAVRRADRAGLASALEEARAFVPTPRIRTRASRAGPGFRRGVPRGVARRRGERPSGAPARRRLGALIPPPSASRRRTGPSRSNRRLLHSSIRL
ncbi:MAG: urease accessory UreF family protein [Rhizomicrobium sp.]